MAKKKVTKAKPVATELEQGSSSVASGDDALNERLSQMVKQLPTGAVYVANGTLSMNRATEEITGYDRAELPTIDQWFSKLYRERATKMRQHYEANREAHFPNVSAMTITRKDGRKQSVEFAAYRFDHHEIWLLHDITERRRVEQALRENEEQLRAILNAAMDAIITIDRQGIIVGANATSERMFRYAKNELIGQTVDILMPLPYRDEHGGYLARYLESGEAHIIGVGRELVGQRKDGTTFPLHLAVSEVDHLGLFIGIVHDITERKKSEELLRHEHQFTESLIDTARHIVLVLDTKGRIVRFNPYMEQLSGWKLDEVKGHDWFSTFLPQREQESIRNLFARAKEESRTRGNVNRLLTKDGQEREIEWYDAPLTDANGKVVGLLCTGQDITERRILEREILDIAAEEQQRIGQELHDSTQQQLTGLGLLAQNVAALLGRLCKADEESPILREAGLLDSIKGLQQKVTHIHHGLEQTAREVSQLSRGLIPVELDSQGLMSSLTELAHSITEVQQIECIFTSDGTIELTNNYTATQLFRIAQEAVNNALKHSQAHHIKISISEVNNDGIILKVFDNGIGFDQKGPRGPGMGLRIMAYRAELIGATLSVGRANGQGTEVTCTVTHS